jgi:hypothetical protein
MSKLNISEAARATDKPRSTIQRNIKKGVLSAEKDATGRTVIDVSELQRVFGNLDMDAVAGGAEQTEAKEQSATPKNQAEMELLQLKLAYAERERDEAQRREREQSQQFREERDRLLGIIETQTKQIAAISPPVEFQEPTPSERRGFWKRMFG